MDALQHIDTTHPDISKALRDIIRNHSEEFHFILIHKLFLGHNNTCDQKLNVIDFERD